MKIIHMVTVTKSNAKEVKEFGKREWSKVNIDHYGKDFDYKQKKIVFKSEDNGTIVGSIKGSHEAGVLYIDYLIVADVVREKGIGKQLMESLEIWGKKLGAHKAHLITGKGWGAAKFYEKLGYKQVAVLPQHYLKKDFVVYEKMLS